MVRDQTRALTYAAEDSTIDLLKRGGKITAFNSTFELDPLLKFGSLDAVQIFLDSLKKNKEFRGAYPIAAESELAVRARRGGAFAHYQSNVIALHDAPNVKKAWSMNMAVVLHEVAHWVVDHEALGDVASHGDFFREVLVNLFEIFISPEASFLLKTNYMEAGL